MTASRRKNKIWGNNPYASSQDSQQNIVIQSAAQINTHTQSPTCDGVVELILIVHLLESKATSRLGQMNSQHMFLLEANPSEFLRRATRQSKSLWSVAKETMSRDRPKARTTAISISAGDVNHSKPALGQQADECCHVWALLGFLVPLTRSQLVTCRDKRGQHTVLEIHGKTCYHVTAATTSYNRSVIWRKLDRHLSHQLKVCCVRPSLGHHGPLTANKSFLVQLLHDGDTTASGSLGLSYLQSGSSSFHTSYPFSHSVTKDGLWNETAWRKKIRGCDQKVETSSGQQMLQQDKINNC